MLEVLTNMDRTTVHAVSHAVDVGVCLSSSDCLVPFRAQQSSKQAEGKEHISVRGRGHLEAAGLE